MTEETKSGKFRRLRDKRLPKIIHSIGLLANLSRRCTYEYTRQEAVELCRAVQDAASQLSEAFGCDTPKSNKMPTSGPGIGHAGGIQPSAGTQKANPSGANLNPEDRANIAWALDMLQRGEIEDAKILIRRVLGGGKFGDEDKTQ